MSDRVFEPTLLVIYSGLYMSHFDSYQLTLIWLVHIALNYWQPTDSPARRKRSFFLFSLLCG